MGGFVVTSKKKPEVVQCSGCSMYMSKNRKIPYKGMVGFVASSKSSAVILPFKPYPALSTIQKHTQHEHYKNTGIYRKLEILCKTSDANIKLEKQAIYSKSKITNERGSWQT